MDQSSNGDSSKPLTGGLSQNLIDQANRCRRLARATHDRSASEILERMASDFERDAGGGSPATA